MPRIIQIVYRAICKHDKSGQTISVSCTVHDLAKFIKEKFGLQVTPEDVFKFLRGNPVAGNTMNEQETEAFNAKLAKWGIHRIQTIVPEKSTVTKKRATYMLYLSINNPPDDVEEWKEEELRKFREEQFPMEMPLKNKQIVNKIFPKALWALHKNDMEWPDQFVYNNPLGKKRKAKSPDDGKKKKTSRKEKQIALVREANENCIVLSRNLTLEDLSSENDGVFSDYYKLCEQKATLGNPLKVKSPPPIEMKSSTGHAVQYIRLPIRTGNSKKTNSRKIQDYQEYLNWINEQDRMIFVKTVHKLFPDEFQAIAAKNGMIKVKKLSIEKCKQFCDDYSLSATKVRKISTFLAQELGTPVFPCHSKIYAAVKMEFPTQQHQMQMVQMQQLQHNAQVAQMQQLQGGQIV